MRNVANMVDRSTWDQSFIDGVSTLPSSFLGDVQDGSGSVAVETGSVDTFPAIVSPRALLLWNGDPSDHPRVKGVVGTDSRATCTNISNGFLNPFLVTNSPDNNGFVGTPVTRAVWNMCGAVAAPPCADLTCDDRIYENTLDLDDCSTGTSVFFSQPSSPGSAVVGDLPFQTSHHSAFLATGSRSRSTLPSLENMPSESGAAVFTAPTGVSVKCRVQSTPSSGSISTSGLSSSRGSNCSTSDVSAAAASMHFRSSNSPPRSCGQDSGNGSDDDRIPPFVPVPDGAPFCRTSAADEIIVDTTGAKAPTHWQRDASDERVFGGLASAYSRVANFLPAWDLERLETVYFRLAVCGFYYGRMSIDEAAEKLCRQPVGTFVLRDSADSRFLFSVSVQTCRGPTSIRIAYRSGLFRLDCTPDQEHLLPTFDCALRLVSHYVRLCGGGGGTGNASARRTKNAVAPGANSYVFLESSGRRDTPVLLRTPFRDRPQRLGHLCRRAVHAALGRGPAGAEADRDAAVDRLPVVPSLKTYLKDYPYDL